MRNKRKHLSTATIIFVCSLVVLLSAAHIYRLFKLGANYTTLIINTETGSNTSLEETYAYAPPVNRIKFGQPTNDSYVREYSYQRSPFMSEFLPTIGLGQLAKIIGVPFSWIIVKVLGPILLMLLMRQIGILTGADSFTSIVAALVAVFMPMLFSLLPYPVTLNYIAGATELEFQRLFHPLLSMIIISLYVICVHKALTSKYNWPIILFSGVLLGTLFYTYFFAWTLVWISMGLVVVTCFNKRERDNLKILMAIIMMGMVIGIPYIINGWQFSNSNMGQDFWEKSLIPIKEVHIWKMIRYLLLIILTLRLDRDWAKQLTKKLLLSLMISAIILPDLSQVLLGGNIESDHWIVRFLYPLSTFVAVLSMGFWLNKRFPAVKALILWLLTVIVAIRLMVIINYQMRLPVNLFQLSGERRQLFTFMEQNLEYNSVIGSLSFTEEIYLAAYTPFYPFIPRWERTIAPETEPMERLLFLTQQLKVVENYFDDVMPVPLVPINYQHLPRFDQKALAVVFGIEYLFDQPPYYRHQALLKQTKEKYRQIIPQPGRLDYILITPTDRQFANWAPTDNCQPLFSNLAYQLYRFNDCWRL